MARRVGASKLRQRPAADSGPKTRRAKIVAPELPRWWLSRPALEAQLDAGLERRVTTVVAGPGFGKTTLLAEWAARHPHACWYTVGREDRSVATFVRGIAAAVAHVDPGISSSFAGVTAGGSGDERMSAASSGALLVEALESCAADAIALVLDDVQEVTRGSGPARLIETLVREAPGMLHVTLSSRSPPPFPIERLRGRGQVMALDPSRLALSEAEVEALVNEVLAAPNQELARRVHALSCGWPAAVRLALEALRNAPPVERDAILERLSTPEGTVFAYLAEEVFRSEPARVRALLQRVALFDWFTPGLCAAIGLVDVTKTLRDLALRGLFVYPDAGVPGRFVLHGLVREFARMTWPLQRDELRRVQRRAARWLEAHGELEDAARWYEEAADWRRVAALLRTAGPSLIASGRGAAVLRAAERLPAELRDAPIEELVGDACRISGDSQAALAHFLRAAGDAETLPPRLAWRIGLVHYPGGNLGEAIRTYARARIETGTTRDEAILFGYWACAHVKRGELDPAQAFAARSFDAARASGDDLAYAHAHTALASTANAGGDLSTGEVHYRRALDAADRANDVREMARTRINLADALTEQGRSREALEELDAAVGLAEIAGYDTFLPLALSNRGEAYLALGRLEPAIADLERVRALRQRLGPRFAGSSLVHLGDAYRTRGDLALARAVYEETVALGEGSGNLEWLRVALSGLARVLAREEPDRAAALAQRAIESERGLGEDTITALLAHGWVALVQGRASEANADAVAAATAARSRGSRGGIAEALELQALATPDPDQRVRLLTEAVAIRRDIDDVFGACMTELAIARISQAPIQTSFRRKLQKLGIRPAAAEAAGLLMALGPERPADVSIQTLGGFRVLRRGASVPTREWQSRKARDLLKMLIAHRGRPTPRDLLMERLWPGEDPQVTANRLSVALSTVRAVLDPDHSFESDHFLATMNNAVSLRLAALSLDVDDFLRTGEAGIREWRSGNARGARDLLEAAEEAYAGDFLEEDLYDDWALPLREEARALYVAVTSALGDLATAVADHEAAIRYRLRVLERDPYDEDAHIAVVLARAAAGQHGEARRAYRRYVTQMEAIDVEPAPFPRQAARRPATDVPQARP